jgi:hypothetical protein
MTAKSLKMPKRLLLKSRRLLGGVSVKERQASEVIFLSLRGPVKIVLGSGSNLSGNHFR